MSFLLLIFNIFLNCNRKWGIIVKIGVVIGGKKTIIGGRRGIIGTSSADRAPTEECSVDAVGMHIIIYMATGKWQGHHRDVARDGINHHFKVRFHYFGLGFMRCRMRNSRFIP